MSKNNNPLFLVILIISCISCSQQNANQKESKKGIDIKSTPIEIEYSGFEIRSLKLI